MNGKTRVLINDQINKRSISQSNVKCFKQKKYFKIALNKKDDP